MTRELIAPAERIRESFLVAVQEFRDEGRMTPDDMTMLAREYRLYGEKWADPNGFAEYVAALRADALEETPRPENFVPATTLWLVDGDEYLGRIAIRHRLTRFLLDQGGHIGYDTRPTARGKGVATDMLRGALAVSAALGIEAALVTCDVTNAASRRVIEKCGGVFEDQRGDKLRFWIRTAGKGA